jgi:DNA-directed RNA polymerase specialized sigma24 family protein
MDDTMGAVSESAERQTSGRLASPEMRRLIERFVRRRVPAGDVDDIVQTVLCDALASQSVPDDDEQLRRWLMGITRHKVADFHRGGARGGRTEELGDHHPADAPPLEARAMARWAEKQTEGDDDAARTLDWMAREGGGEKLAHIAADAKVSPEVVRQRVSRMRRFMRDKWAAELAAVAVIVTAAVVLWLVLRKDEPVAQPLPQPAPEHLEPDPRMEQARELRQGALRECERAEWQRCLAGLDEAAKLDPEGDRDDVVQDARREAAEAMSQKKGPETKNDGPRTDESSKPPPVAPPAPPPTKQTPKETKKPSDKESLLDKKKLEEEKRRAEKFATPDSNSSDFTEPDAPKSSESPQQQLAPPSQQPSQAPLPVNTAPEGKKQAPVKKGGKKAAPTTGTSGGRDKKGTDL